MNKRIVPLLLLFLLGCTSTVNGINTTVAPAETAITLAPTVTPTITLTPTLTPIPTPASISPENIHEIVPVKKITSDTQNVFKFYNSVAFSPDLNTYATTYDAKTLLLWDMTTGQQIDTVSNDEPIGDVIFSPDSKSIAISGRTITLWDATSGSQISVDSHCPGSQGNIVFSPDGKTIYTGDIACNVMTGQTLYTFDCPSSCFHVAISPDGKILATTADVGFTNGKHEINLWDTMTGERILTLDGDIYPPGVDSIPILSLAFSPDGRTLASMDSRNTTIIWDLAVGEKVSVFDPISQKAGISPNEIPRTQWSTRSLAFSPDGKLLVAGYARGSLIFWDVQNSKPLYVIPSTLPSEFLDSISGEGILSVAFSSDGRTLVAANQNNAATIWGLLPGQHMETPTPPVLQGMVILDTTDSFATATTFSESSKAHTYPISIGAGTFSILLNTDDNSNICYLVWQVRPASDPKGQTGMFGDSNVPGSFTVDRAADYVISIGRARVTDQCQPFSYTLKVIQP